MTTLGKDAFIFSLALVELEFFPTVVELESGKKKKLSHTDFALHVR